MGEVQREVSSKFGDLPPAMQERYRKVAFIMNRPCGPIEDRGYREFIQKEALEGISLRMRLLNESCGVMNVFFGTASADSSSNHYQLSSVNLM